MLNIGRGASRHIRRPDENMVQAAQHDTQLLPQPVVASLDRVGRYQIRERIGQGAMASVYKAYDPEIDRTIAVKLLHPEFCEDDSYRTRFVREAKGAGVLSHPNIVTVFDVGEHKGQPYIAMELVEGLPLSDLLREKKPLETKLAVDVGIQLAKALDYAHKKGIVHRDVKPGNIMLVRDTQAVKVADFGICRIENGDATHKTRVGDVLGTPHYMSPEQVLGQKVDARSDLFSAGIVLYQLLTGVLPFDADTLVSVALQIAKTDPVSLDKLRPDLPLSLRRIVDRALRKQPERRFQTGEELAHALIAVAKELKESEEVAQQKRRIPLRVRWATLMAALVALTMLVAGTLISQRQREALQEQVMDYGGSLAKFMAAQCAVPMLAEDWTALEVFVGDAVTGQDFAYMRVVDRGNIIRGSNVAAEVGASYAAPSGMTVAANDTGITVQRHVAAGKDVLDFAAPVRFQGTEIGRVHLGVQETALKRISQLTWLMLGLLTLLTSGAVALGSYLLAQRLSQPMRVLRNSLAELGKGHYDYRIAASRSDEFGDLFTAFDAAAAALQQRHEPSASAPAHVAPDESVSATAR